SGSTRSRSVSTPGPGSMPRCNQRRTTASQATPAAVCVRTMRAMISAGMPAMISGRINGDADPPPGIVPAPLGSPDGPAAAPDAGGSSLTPAASPDAPGVPAGGVGEPASGSDVPGDPGTADGSLDGEPVAGGWLDPDPVGVGSVGTGRVGSGSDGAGS